MADQYPIEPVNMVSQSASIFHGAAVYPNINQNSLAGTFGTVVTGTRMRYDGAVNSLAGVRPASVAGSTWAAIAAPA